MLLHTHTEALHRNPLPHRQHERRARRDLPELVAPRGDDADAVDVRPSRMDLEVDSFLFEESETLGDDFTELVTAGEPSELHVEDGESVDARPSGETSSERAECECTGSKKTTAIENFGREAQVQGEASVSLPRSRGKLRLFLSALAASGPAAALVHNSGQL